MRRALVTLAWLACAALSAAACSASALAAGEREAPQASSAIRALATAAPAAPSATSTPSASPAALLAREAYAYMLSVQADEQRDTDASLPRDVCSATFSELESATRQASIVASSPVLSEFLTAAAAISSSCELRQVGGIRSAVIGLNDLSAAVADLAH